MDSTDVYCTIDKSGEGNYKEKGSKFLSFAFPVENQSQIKLLTDELKQRFYNARHHCFAWELGTDGMQYRANDDGEPSGTAGKPILGQIRSHNLTNVLIVVVRYFGGTKLGVGGLTRAYRAASADALAHTSIVERTENKQFLVHFPYDLMNSVMRVINQDEGEIVEQSFGAGCAFRISVRLSRFQQLTDRIQTLEGTVVEREETNDRFPTGSATESL